jgi:hypothetical protein
MITSALRTGAESSRHQDRATTIAAAIAKTACTA